MEQLAGRRKDLAAVHYEKVLELYEMQTGRRISLPYHMEARRDYEGVRLCRCGEEKSAGMIGEKHEGSDIQKTEKQFAEKIYQTGNGKSRIPGDCDQSAWEFFRQKYFCMKVRRLKKKSIRNGWIMIK